MNILRLYDIKNGNVAKIYKFDKKKPKYDSELYTDVVPPFNINLRPEDKNFINLKFENGKWIEEDLSLQNYKIIRKNELSLTINKHFSCGIKYKDCTLYSGDRSAINIYVLGITAMKNGNDVPLWKVQDGNNIIKPTSEQLKEMYDLVLNDMYKVYSAEETITNEIYSFTEVQNIINYNVDNRFNSLIKN